MYYDEFFPFYAVYADPEVYDRELQQEREAELMRSRYPQTARELQDYIHEEADLMAVSYTHLDVYKRQGCSCTFQRNGI